MYISNEFVAFLILFIKQLNNNVHFVYVDGDNKQVLRALQDTIPEVCFIQIDEDNLTNLQASLSKVDKALFFDLSTDPYTVHDTILALANVSAHNVIFKVSGYCAKTSVDIEKAKVFYDRYADLKQCFSFMIDNTARDDSGNYVGSNERSGYNPTAIRLVRDDALHKYFAPYCPEAQTPQTN